jgi:hypothetical protein
MTLDEDFRVVISARLRRDAESAELPCSLAEAHGRRIRLPERMPPDAGAVERHRREVFAE